MVILDLGPCGARWSLAGPRGRSLSTTQTSPIMFLHVDMLRWPAQVPRSSEICGDPDEDGWTAAARGLVCGRVCGLVVGHQSLGGISADPRAQRSQSSYFIPTGNPQDFQKKTFSHFIFWHLVWRPRDRS